MYGKFGIPLQDLMTGVEYCSFPKGRERIESNLSNRVLVWEILCVVYTMGRCRDSLDSDYLEPMVPRTCELSDKSSYISAAGGDGYLIRLGFESKFRDHEGFEMRGLMGGTVLGSKSTPPGASSSPHNYEYARLASPTQSEGVFEENIEGDINAGSGSSGDMRHESLEWLPEDTRFVEVTPRMDNNRQYYCYECDGELRETQWENWVKIRTPHNGEVLKCYLNTRENSLQFWTWNLDINTIQVYQE
jgi:hypothetical protein